MQKRKLMKTFLTYRGLVVVLFALLFQACSEDAYSDDSETNTMLRQPNATNSGSPYGESTDLTFEVTNIGASSYVFNNDDLNNVQNPDLTLKRGETYTFTINAPGHPFLIKSVLSVTDANTYNEGVTNNGAASGTITFEVPMDAPDTLYYVCEFHAAMSGVFTIED